MKPKQSWRIPTSYWTLPRQPRRLPRKFPDHPPKTKKIKISKNFEIDQKSKKLNFHHPWTSSDLQNKQKTMALKKIQMWCRSVVRQDRSGTDWLLRRIITCKDDYGTGGALRVTIIVAQEDCGACSLRHMIIAHEDHSVWRSFSVTIIAPEDDGAKVGSREIGRRLSHSMRSCINKDF